MRDALLHEEQTHAKPPTWKDRVVGLGTSWLLENRKVLNNGITTVCMDISYGCWLSGAKWYYRQDTIGITTSLMKSLLETASRCIRYLLYSKVNFTKGEANVKLKPTLSQISNSSTRLNNRSNRVDRLLRNLIFLQWTDTVYMNKLAFQKYVKSVSQKGALQCRSWESSESKLVPSEIYVHSSPWRNQQRPLPCTVVTASTLTPAFQ